MTQALLSLTVKGDTSFRFHPQAIIAEVMPKVPACMNAGMLVIRDEGRRNLEQPAPGAKYKSDVTGNLKRSIDVLPVAEVGRTLVGAIKADAAEAAVVENGRAAGKKGPPFKRVKLDEYEVPVKAGGGRRAHTRKAGGMRKVGKKPKGEDDRPERQVMVSVYAFDEWMRHARTLNITGDDPRALRERARAGFAIAKKMKDHGIAARRYLARAVEAKGEAASALTIKLVDQAIAAANRKALPGVR